MDSVIEEFGVIPAEVSPTRSTVINSASSTRGPLVDQRPANVFTKSSRVSLVQEQQDFYEESRKKIARGTKAYVEAGIERQRVESSITFLYIDACTDLWNRWPQMPRNSFDTTTHFSNLQHRSELPR